jgi:YggT family protein
MPEILSWLLFALKALIIVDFVLSWIMPPDKFPRSLTTQITDPLYAPIRAILRPERMGGLDLSPMVILLLVQAMESMMRKVQ